MERKLEQYRTYIGQYINHSISADTARSTTTPPDLQLILSMYNGMSKKQKGEFVTNNDTFNASSLKGKICFACYAYNENLHKCIHVDCTGCCKACQSIPLLVPEETLTDAGGGGDPDAPPTMHLVCRACHRKQEIQCPICLESKSTKRFVYYRMSPRILLEMLWYGRYERTTNHQMPHVPSGNCRSEGHIKLKPQITFLIL